MAQEPTIVGSWLGLIADTLDSHGIDSESFIKTHGMDPSRISDPDYRVQFSHLKRLWESAVSETGDEGLGLKVGSHVHPTSFHALGLVLLSSTTLKEMFHYLARYLAMFTTGAHLELRETDNDYRLHGRYEVNEFGQPYSTDLGVDATLAAIVTVSRAHYGDDFRPLRVELPRSQPRQAGIHEEFFGCPVSYNCENLLLILDKSQLEAPIAHGNAQLAHGMEKLVNEYLARMDSSDLTGRIRAKLLVMLPQGTVDKNQIAESLSMSPRTLHRKLQGLGTSYQKLLDDARQELALKYLAQPDLSILEISFLLGFSNSNSFTRFFRQRSGSSPQEYRKDELGIS